MEQQIQQTGNSIPQSNQPIQSSQPQQVVEQPVKKSKWWLWAIIAILIIAIVGAGVYFLFF